MCLRLAGEFGKMIFIVGNSRSGTTMMGRILGNHQDIFTFGELHFFGQLWSPVYSSQIDINDAVELASKLFCIQCEGYRTHGDANTFKKDAQLFCGTIPNYPIDPAMLFSEFLSYVALKNSKSIPCDQTPRNVFYIDVILNNFPDAKIINMIRDPRDVLLSQKSKWKRRYLGGTDLSIKESIRDWVNYHPITISKIWNTAITVAGKFSDHSNVITIYFEKLLSNPESTVREICDFVDINYTPSLLQVPQVGSSVGEDKPAKLGINPERAGNWNHKDNTTKLLNSSDIYITQKLNGNLMKKHNYQLIRIRPNFLTLIIYLITFPIKLSGAFMFNLDRVRNLRETLRRRL